MILKYSRMLLIVGGTLTVAGAFSQLMNVNVASYIFTAGAAMLIVYQFMAYMADKKKDLRTQRLSRLNFIYSLLLGLAAFYVRTVQFVGGGSAYLRPSFAFQFLPY